MTAAEAAGLYIDRGLLPVPIPTREKAPKLDGWPTLRLQRPDLPRYFNGGVSNIGLILGDDYGTADIDLDSPEAIAAATELLPETGMIFGRHSKPRSHFFYRADPPIRSKRYLDPIDKACLVELRCRKADDTIGLQTVVPPSIHPTGEQIRFESGGDGHPANIDAVALQTATARVAAASLLARRWPGEKAGRNQTFIALAGTLARAGWPLDDAIAFHRALYRILWGVRAQVDACVAEVRATYEKHAGGFSTTGKNSLEEAIDKRAVRSALSWVGITQPPPPARDEDVPASRSALRPRAPVIAAPKSMAMEDLMNDESVAVEEHLIADFLLKRGLALLGGRPKDGKTWLAVDIALAVVTGRPLGGWMEVKEPGRVHLWALEDRFPITKDKVAKLLRGARPDGLRDLRVFEELPAPILNGGDNAIRAALKEHPAELIIRGIL